VDRIEVEIEKLREQLRQNERAQKYAGKCI
jgi:hypothetical protein